VFFVALFICREHVVDWAKFLYVAFVFLVYVGVVVTHPIPINPGFNALWFLVCFVAYGFARFVTRITIGYKDRTDRPIFIAASTQVGQV
jgi:hypothetical protein